MGATFYQSVDSVIDHAPSDWLFDQDDALGSWVLVFECGFENHALVIAFRRAHKFLHVRPTDKFSRESIPKWRPARFHYSDELPLLSRHSEILRFPSNSFF